MGAPARDTACWLNQNAFDGLSVACSEVTVRCLPSVIWERGNAGSSAWKAPIGEDKQLAGVAGAVGGHRDGLASRFQLLEDKLSPIHFAGDGTHPAFGECRQALCALVDHHRQPPVGEPV